MAENAPFALTTKLLRQSQAPAEFELYKAALEWSLVDPIIINSRDDLKSEARWKSQGLEPFHHQVTNLLPPPSRNAPCRRCGVGKNH